MLVSLAKENVLDGVAHELDVAIRLAPTPALRTVRVRLPSTALAHVHVAAVLIGTEVGSRGALVAEDAHDGRRFVGHTTKEAVLLLN